MINSYLHMLHTLLCYAAHTMRHMWVLCNPFQATQQMAKRALFTDGTPQSIELHNTFELSSFMQHSDAIANRKPLSIDRPFKWKCRNTLSARTQHNSFTRAHTHTHKTVCIALPVTRDRDLKNPGHLNRPHCRHSDCIVDWTQ